MENQTKGKGFSRPFLNTSSYSWKGLSRVEKIYLLPVLVIICDNLIPAVLTIAGRVSSAQWLLRENGIYESFGAFVCLLGSIIFFLAYIKFPWRNNFGFFVTKRNVFFLLLAIFLLFIVGEEISWGQGLFGFQAPDFMSYLNFQNELNIHNLKIIQESNNALAIKACRLLLAYLMLLPIALKAFPAFEIVFKATGIPVPSFRISLLTALTYFMDVTLMGHEVIGNVSHDNLHEAFETNLEIVLFVFAIECYFAAKTKIAAEVSGEI